MDKEKLRAALEAALLEEGSETVSWMDVRDSGSFAFDGDMNLDRLADRIIEKMTDG